jgi:hypothetical protein
VVYGKRDYKEDSFPSFEKKLWKNGVEIVCWKKVIYKGMCEGYKTWCVLFYFIFSLLSLPLGMVVVHLCLMSNNVSLRLI